METNLLNIKGISVISKNEQKQIKGAIGLGNGSIGTCGCDCAGRVTGPLYCHAIIACPQVYTCNDAA